MRTRTGSERDSVLAVFLVGLLLLVGQMQPALPPVLLESAAAAVAGDGSAPESDPRLTPLCWLLKNLGMSSPSLSQS